MELETIIISSLTKVFPDEVKGERMDKATLLQNEPFSFQIAFKSKKPVLPVYVRIDSDLDLRYVSEYLVGYVPVTRATYVDTDEFYDRKTPGLYPDMLLKRKTNAEVDNDGYWCSRWFERDQKNLINACCDSYQSLWVTLNENGNCLPAGKHYISVEFYSAYAAERLSCDTIELEILNAELPEQDITYTSWVHYDCLADTYGVKVFSEEHFRIMRSFITEAAKTGMNMILLPAFTPPLDTSVGKERKTVQLVGVTCKNGKYTFDFSLMKRFIEMCRECGINRFEHSHLFTQWGAYHATKIMANVDGEYKRLFGWNTDSTGNEYAEFLKCYLRELKKFLKEVGIDKNIMFHISDEPPEKCIPYYENAHNIVAGELDGFDCGDALSHYKFYENGNIKLPIVVVSSDDMNRFTENCKKFWVYYTAEQLHDGYSNRIISTTNARNRILGLQMYVSGAKGFLHWGYNYYYDTLSHGFYNPVSNPCGCGQVAGSAFIVYPQDDGTAIPSIRMKVFYEGINDYRALERLEKLIGRKAVLKFIKEQLGEITFKTCFGNAKLFEFRQRLNEEIKKYL